MEESVNEEPNVDDDIIEEVTFDEEKTAAIFNPSNKNLPIKKSGETKVCGVWQHQPKPQTQT